MSSNPTRVRDVEPAANANRWGSPFRRRWVILIMASVAATALVVGTVIALNVAQSSREQEYLSTLRADPESRVQGLPDEQLLVSLRSECERIADGWTLGDAVSASERNWSGVSSLSTLTKEEYKGNVRALFRAAEEVCD